jgi:hypothetical protein
MAHAIVLSRQTIAVPQDFLRGMMVCGCALALILAS